MWIAIAFVAGLVIGGAVGIVVTLWAQDDPDEDQRYEFTP